MSKTLYVPKGKRKMEKMENRGWHEASGKEEPSGVGETTPPIGGAALELPHMAECSTGEPRTSEFKKAGTEKQ